MFAMRLDPKEQAEKILWEYWQEDVFPVDPVKIARSLGMKVTLTNLNGGVSGVIYKDKGDKPVICLNRTEGYLRLRFTCAQR
jgi:hypothetical protein